jgi:hypothetical protein
MWPESATVADCASAAGENHESAMTATAMNATILVKCFENVPERDRKEQGWDSIFAS